MHMYNFLCSDSLLYFFLFLSTLHSVYTRDCSWMWFFLKHIIIQFYNSIARINPPCDAIREKVGALYTASGLLAVISRAYP